MKFLIEWEMSESRSDAEQARILALFAKWEPPIELSNWSGFVDGSGGFAIAEAVDADALARVTNPWTPWFRFSIRAVQPIEQTAVCMQEAVDFRRSIT